MNPHDDDISTLDKEIAIEDQLSGLLEESDKDTLIEKLSEISPESKEEDIDG